MSRRELLLSHVKRLEFDDSAPRARFRVAGVRVDFLSRSAETLGRVVDYFDEYLDDSAERAEAEVYAEPVDGAQLWDDPDPEFDVRGDSVVQRDFCASRLVPGDRAVALVAPELDDAIQNLMRWLLPPVLLRHGAFLMHGAGAVRDGRGYAFFGQSGAGKSTTAGLIAQADPSALIVGDDAVIVQLDEESGRAYLLSAPLGCGYSRLAPPPVRAPLAGLYALRQADAHRVRSLAPAAGAAGLIASAMSVRFDDAVDARLELALGFATRGVGVSELSFKKDPGFWPLLLKPKETPRAAQPERQA